MSGHPAPASPPAARPASPVPLGQVRDALAHLYDPGHLQTHPLAALTGGSERTGRGRALQRALLEAVEGLKPPRDGRPGPKALRRYQLLKRRYVDGLAPEEVQGELLVGRSEYYREHERAIRALASLLGERLGPPPTADAAPAVPLGEPAGTLPPPATVPGPGEPTTAFVGREAELGALRARLGAAAGGRGGVVMLVGEPGIGKTRLAQELGRVAGERGALVLWGRCYEGDGSLPYGPWVEALGAYAAATDPERLRRQLGAAAPPLASLVPATRVALPGLPAAAALGPEQERFRLHDAVAQALLAVAREQPVLLVIDDLHWADRDSLALLRHVGRFLGGARLLVATAYRDVEVDRRHPLREVLAMLRREVDYERITVRGLDDAAAAAYLAALAGQELPPALLRALQEQAAGSPFYLRELFRHLVEDGKLVRRDGSWSTGVDLAELGMPEGVRQVVGRRVARLSGAAGALLRAASGFTGGFRFAVLPALSGLPEDALLDALDEALDAGLLRTLPGRGETYDFAHAIVRHALYDELNASRRARLHRRIAEAIERAHAGQEAEHAAELAAQYHASATLPGAERGIPHALLAAEQARAGHAAERAVVFLRMARDLAAAAPTTTRARVLARLAVAEAEAVLVAQAPASAEAALGALEANGAPPEEIAGFVSAVARALKDGGAGAAVWAPLVERGLALLGDERVLVWARLMLLRDAYEPIAVGGFVSGRWLGYDPAAVALARAHGDEDDWARSLEPLEPRSRPETEAVRALTRRWRSPAAVIRGLDVVARDLMYRHGDFRGAAGAYEELLAAARRYGSVPAQAEALAQLTTLRGLLGELEETRRTRERARELVGRLGTEHRLHFVLEVGHELLLAYYARGDWAAVAARAAAFAAAPAAARSPLGLTGAAYAALARVRCGDRAEAHRLLAAIGPVAQALEPRTYMWNVVVDVAATAVWELAARDLAPRFRRLARTALATGPGLLGSNELTLARLLALTEGPAAARELFARARTGLESDGRHPLRAIVDHDEALVLLGARPPDRPGAAPLLSAALAQFEALGMDAWAAQARALRDGVRPAAWGPTPEADVDGLTERELEVLRLIAAGRTNREIADALVIAVRTAEHHVANVYAKIGARGRAEAAAYAVGRGLAASG